jgi:hypothetical protein
MREQLGSFSGLLDAQLPQVQAHAFLTWLINLSVDAPDVLQTRLFDCSRLSHSSVEIKRLSERAWLRSPAMRRCIVTTSLSVWRYISIRMRCVLRRF